MIFFTMYGNFPSFRQSYKTIDSPLEIEFPHNCINWILSTSWPWAFFGSKLFVILAMSYVVKITESRDFLVSFARL